MSSINNNPVTYSTELEKDEVTFINKSTTPINVLINNSPNLKILTLNVKCELLNEINISDFPELEELYINLTVEEGESNLILNNNLTLQKLQLKNFCGTTNFKNLNLQDVKFTDCSFYTLKFEASIETLTFIKSEFQELILPVKNINSLKIDNCDSDIRTSSKITFI